MDPRAVILGLVLLALPCVAAHALTPSQSFAQYARNSWAITSGLPQISINAIAQGPDGYLWFGTQDGLARFDGVRFRTLLPSVWVQALMTDRGGTLWIGIYKGLKYYRHGQFGVPQRAPGFPALDPDKLNALAFTQLANGRVLVATPQGLFDIDNDMIAPDARLAHAPAYSLAQLDGTLWVGSRGCVYRIANGQVSRLALPDKGTMVYRLSVYAHSVWLGTDHGLYRYASGGWRRLAGDPPALRTEINAMLVDSDGNFWVASDAGLARIRDGRVVEFVGKHAPGAVPAVQSLYEDREHNLWVGSYTSGVTRLWNSYVQRFSVQQGLSDPLVWAVAPAAHGGIWVGTTAGVYLLNDGHARRVIPGASLPDPNVEALLDDGHSLWIGTNNGLRIFAHGRLSAPAGLGALRSAHYVHGILRDSHGAYWIATADGLYRYAHHVLSHFGTAQGLSDPRCRVLLETHDGRLLVGTADGLYAYGDGRLLRVGATRGLPEHILVSALTELPGGELVVGTLTDAQMFWFDGNRWHTLGRAQGLPLAQTVYLAYGPGDWLWVGSSHGIYRFTLDALHALLAGRGAQLHPQMLLSENGMWPGSQQGYCCNSGGGHDGFVRNDQLWLASQDGVVQVNTAHVAVNKTVPPVRIEALQSAGQWHVITGDDDPPLSLPAADRDLAFRFTVLSLQSPRSVRLKYRLVGYDPHWKMLDDVTKRVAYYTNLPPGAYALQVMGANNDGVWNPDPAVLQFSVAAYFYETLWFRSLVLILVLTAIYLGYRFQLRHLHRQRARLKDIVSERTAELHLTNQQLAGANRRLADASQTDWLTGLRNRRYLYEQLPLELAAFRERRQQSGHADEVMVFALADIDNFKGVNDMQGHAQGDEVLRQIARHFEEVVCDEQLVVRWGGEEFLLVFRPMPRSEVATTVTRVQRAVSESTFLGLQDERLQLTCSIGFAEHPFAVDMPGTDDWETLVNIADLALYRAKDEGRNTWVGLRPGPRFNARTLAADFRRGLAAMLESQILIVLKP